MNEFSVPDYSAIIADCIPDDSVMVSVKIDLDADYDVESNPGSIQLSCIRDYLIDCNVKVICSTVGLHVNGEHKKPHLHYHMACERFNKPSNPSQHRQRWLSKDNDRNLDGVSVMYQKIDTTQPKYSFLSYPLKEGFPCNLHHGSAKDYFVIDSRPMEKGEKKYLVDVGTEIYNKQLGLRMRQDKCVERKQLALTCLYQLCFDNKHLYSSYKEMLRWLDTNYIDMLELTEMPDPKNYKTNTQKIATKLGFLKYSDL